MRKLIGHLPTKTRAKSTWQHVIAELNAAARGGDLSDAAVALQLVLVMENVTVQAK